MLSLLNEIFKELKKFLNLENFYTKAELREVKLRKLGI